jgi:hypothetical protein
MRIQGAFPRKPACLIRLAEDLLGISRLDLFRGEASLERLPGGFVDQDETQNDNIPVDRIALGQRQRLLQTRKCTAEVVKA